MNGDEVTRPSVEELVEFLEDFAGDKDGAGGGFAAADWSMCPLSEVERIRLNLRESAARLREEFL
jgi:hypothetical protein